ncbi:MAG: Trk family potassium uptake protein [Clostridia bacterium]|nr:Trk family potassium uptake protein [Clostridia bacterium]
MKKKWKLKFTYTQMIAFGFFMLIMLGSLLLCLPVASAKSQWTPFLDAMFTATSATCVTGLVVYDTYTHWSLFGQIIIIILIQIGGIGFMTVITMFSLVLKRNISLHERKLIMQSAGAINVGGIVALVKKVAALTFLIEGTGACLLAIRFIPERGIADGIYAAVFHSISAFCNAGFDLMGKYEEFSSLTRYPSDPIVNLTICALILIGGLGFSVWSDLGKNKLRWSRYQLHTKLVLMMSGILLIGGTILFFIFEFHATQEGMSFLERLTASLFEATTPRTAGFNTTDINALSESGSILTIVLMFIGGNPGSTAGGIKTTTLLVLIMSISATCSHSPNITVFKRKLEDTIARQAAAIVSIYMIAILAASLVICAIEPINLRQVLFETVSAAGTVGLTTGITPGLSALSKCIIMFLMFGGRVGGLSLALVLSEKRVHVPIERPLEKIMIG